MRQEDKTEIILDFIVYLCREMLQAGANLERINISIKRICKCYHLSDISLLYSGSVLSVGVRDKNGVHYLRQEKVPYTGIHLQKLGRLNRLVHNILQEKPDEDELMALLLEALFVKSYSNGMQICGYELAMVSLCRIFGGSFSDILIVMINTLFLFFATMLFSRTGLNRIISNIVTMCVCGCLAIFFTEIGLSEHMSAIIITNAFYLIPGIPMVNAVRNIFCGNEANGIIEMVKVVLEVVSIVAGLFIAGFLFGADAIVVFSGGII